MMQAARQTAAPSLQSRVETQQHQQQQEQQSATEEEDLQIQQQQQPQQQRQSSHQFACLYTHQKTQKRKKWQDGRFVLESHGRGKLYSANPAPGSGNPILDMLELPRNDVTSILQGHQSNLEAEKHLIQLEGSWTESTASVTKQHNQAVVSTGMQKLLTSKFKLPGKAGTFRPSNPQSSSIINNNVLGKRRRPLQPGELVRQHYGENTGPTHIPGYDDSNSNGNNQTNNDLQNQSPNILMQNNTTATPVWKTPASIVPINPHCSVSREPSHHNQHQLQQQRPAWQQQQRNCNTVQEKAFASTESLYRQGGSSGQPNAERIPTDPGESRGSNITGNSNSYGQRSQPPQEQLQRSHILTSSAPQPFVNTNVTQENVFQAASFATNTTTKHPLTMATKRSAVHEEFVNNGFDPSQFYGLEDDDDDDDDDDDEESDDDEQEGFHLGSQGGWIPRPAKATVPVMVGNENENQQQTNPISDHARNDSRLQATMTKQELLALFGGDDDDDADGDHDHDGNDNTQSQQHPVNEQQTLNPNYKNSNDPTSEFIGIAGSSGNNDAQEFTLPPVDSSSDESSNEE